MSLDGFVAHEDHSIGHLFDWYESGDVAMSWPGTGMASHVEHTVRGRWHRRRSPAR